MYIVLEGLIKSGKTTQTKMLLKYLKNKHPDKEVVLTREPGGTEISDNIRKLVQATEYDEDFFPITDIYLYAASRAQALRQVVKPVLDKGGIVISDRSFVTSLACQGRGQEQGIKKVLEINKAAIEGFEPDIVIFIDLDPTTSLKRKLNVDEDKWEGMELEFFNRSRKGYLDLKNHKMFKGKYFVVDDNQGVREIREEIIKIVNAKR